MQLGGFDWLANHQMVLEARLAAFGGAQAVYKFDYLSYTIPRPLLHDNDTGLPNPVALPFLVDITLPDQSHYKMPGASGYLLDPPPGNRDVPGILARLNLPTGGRIEWSFGRWSFPTGESYNPQQPPRNQPSAVQIDGQAGLTLGVLGPTGLHREMAPVEVATEPVTQLALHRRQLSRQLGAQIEIPVIDGADLDPEPSPTGGPFSCAEPCHAVRHSASAWPGKPGKLVAEVLIW